jgi:hypothetical protein
MNAAHVLRRSARSLALSLVLLGPAGAANEGQTNAGESTVGQAGPAPLARLALGQELSCQPQLPFFCGNLHVSCAGRTSIATFAFRLRVNATQGTLTAAPGTEDLRGSFEEGRAVWDRDGADLIVFSRQDGGYIKLLADGRYSLRIYAPQGALMSLGRCE